MGHQGDEFVGEVVSVLDGISVLFLLQETYGADVFCSCPKAFCYNSNPNSG
jgi:hypothetical protein